MPRAEPFRIEVPDAVLDDLRERLGRTRRPPELHGPGWELGASAAYLRELLDHWRDRFDWRTQERRLNERPQFRAEVEGAPIHFVHLGAGRGSPDAGRTPVVLLHGWPNTFADLLELGERLAAPAEGDAASAVDVVIPSLPGFAFSGVPDRPFFWRDVPAMVAELMSGVLGYRRFVAHGSDIGAWVANRLAVEVPDLLAGIHVTSASVPELGMRPLTDAERAHLAEAERWEMEDAAYSLLQETRPMTAAVGLTDSPAGLAAWIVEKLREWSDLGDGDLEDVWPKDRTLTLLTLYWATGSIATSFLPYFERMQDPDPKPWRRPSVPAAVAMFPRDISRAPREWAERGYERLVQWTEMPRGGHFPAVEAVDLLGEDIRAALEAFGS